MEMVTVRLMKADSSFVTGAMTMDNGWEAMSAWTSSMKSRIFQRKPNNTSPWEQAMSGK